MIGSLDPRIQDATVVGGGIAGLLAAYQMDRMGYRVTLFEAQNRCGGLIRTEATSWGISEGAAHTILATETVRQFCNELGVPLIDVNPSSSTRWILRDGKLRRLPLGPLELAQAFFRAAFVREDLGRPERTVEEWGKKFLGEKALDYLVDPMVRGIYGVSPKEVSLLGAFPSLTVLPGKSFLLSRLRKPLREKKLDPGKKKSPAKVMTPQGGMGSLVEALENHLRGRLQDRLKLGNSLRQIPQGTNTVLAVPAASAAKLLATDSPDLSRALTAVKYTPLICVTVFLRKKDLRRIPRGIGVLIPKAEKRRCLGVLFNSSSYSGRVQNESDHISVSFILGGSANPELLDFSDRALRILVKKELDYYFGFQGEMLSSVIWRTPQAVPCYDTSLGDLWERARSSWCSIPGQVLFGNYTGDLSLRSMIEAVRGDAFDVKYST